MSPVDRRTSFCCRCVGPDFDSYCEREMISRSKWLPLKSIITSSVGSFERQGYPIAHHPGTLRQNSMEDYEGKGRNPCCRLLESFLGGFRCECFPPLPFFRTTQQKTSLCGSAWIITTGEPKRAEKHELLLKLLLPLLLYHIRVNIRRCQLLCSWPCVFMETVFKLRQS
jgi:hypothetical protein